MDEKVRVLMSIEVPNLDENLEIRSLWLELNTYIKNIGPIINFQDLEDWKLLINVLVQRTDAIGVAKHVGRYPSDKEYVIYMSIPIPNDEQVTYGLPCVKKHFLKKRTENINT